jgi:hypothetical protein
VTGGGMKSKKPQPGFISFANQPKVPDGLKLPDGFDYKILVSGHRNLRKILDQIIRDQKIIMTKELKFFIRGTFPYKPEFIVEDGNLILKIKYDVGEELIGSWLEPNWFKEIKCELLNYLTDPKKDKRKLKKCLFCKEYFIADDIRQKKCKSEDCRRQYQRRQKAKQRELDPVKYI